MVGDQHHRWAGGVACQVGEGNDELFSAAEIEACCGFVQQDQARVGEEGPSQQHALALAR